jgi:putative copper resistance protein D
MAVFWVHMVQHLMLIMVVPALLVLGSPLTLLRAAASARGRGRSVTAVLRSRPVALVTHPLVSLAVYAVVIVATHLTSFMDAMATHGWLMDFEQVAYLASGYLFLLPLVGNEPIRWELPYLGRIALVLVAMTPDTVVGIVLLQTGHDMFPVMFGTHPMWAPAPVRDLQVAGALMWAGGDGLMMLMGIGVVIAMIAHPGPAVLGRRLEEVRRQTLVDHVSRGDTEATALDENADVEEDEAVLAAYNRMLGRLSKEQH